jgi:hypothetical protein
MRLLVALLAALAALLTGAASAAACSCVGGDPRDRLSEARAALVGTVTEERGDPVGVRTYRLSVDETVKGELPEVIEISTDGRSSCGIDLDVGQRVGILLRRASGPYEVGLCDLMEPSDLEAAARPYPAGAGAGTARLLVAGAFHDAGLAALDHRGRLLGWAFGSAGDAVDVCPGGLSAVQAGDDASVIRLRDLAVVARRELPDEAASGVRCLSRSGDRLAADTFDYGARPDRRRLVVLDDGRVRDLGVRATAAVALGTRSAYLAAAASSGYRLLAVDYASGRRRLLAERRGAVGALVLAPDQRRLAFLEVPSPRGSSRLGVVSTGTGSVRTRELRRLRSPLWLSSRRLAVPRDGRRGDIFDSSLRRRGSLPSWSTDLAAISGDRVWWVESGSGLRARRLRGVASPPVLIDYLGGARGLAAVPGGARVTAASRRAPRVGGGAAAALPNACGRRASQ